MMTDALRDAQDAILLQLRREGDPIRPRTLLQTIKDESGLKEIDIREAIWILIGRGAIALTNERRIALTTESQIHTN